MDDQDSVIDLLNDRFDLSQSDVEALAESCGLNPDLAIELLRLALVEHAQIDRHGAKAMFKRSIEDAIESMDGAPGRQA